MVLAKLQGNVYVSELDYLLRALTVECLVISDIESKHIR